MKNPAPKTVPLMQAASDSRDSLRRLAARIAAAGEDQQLRSEALAAAHQVANTHADLRLAFKDSRRAQPSASGCPGKARPLRALTLEVLFMPAGAQSAGRATRPTAKGIA
jgi:hypothetical protein